jgi:hypothetical protein
VTTAGENDRHDKDRIRLASGSWTCGEVHSGKKITPPSNPRESQAAEEVIKMGFQLGGCTVFTERYPDIAGDHRR